jgi:signal transduction histidine kinase
MEALSRGLADATAFLFMLLAFASVREYRRGHGAATAWAATAFVTLGAVAMFGLLPERGPGDPIWNALWWQAVIRVLLAMIIVFPYCLYRLAATFAPPTRATRHLVTGLTVGVVAVGFFLPRFPGPDEPRPGWLVPYVAAIAVQWTAASVFAAKRLWQGSRHRSGVARNRMRLLAIGTAGLNALILVSAFRPDSDGEDDPALQIVTLLTGIVLYVGLAPPHTLVERWRRPAQVASRNAMAELMTAATASDVATKILPNILTMVGGESAAVYGKDRQLVASAGDLPASAHVDDPRAGPTDGVLRFGLRSSGALVVRASSYSPLFGSDKLEVLGSFANLLDLALARCAAVEKEREFISNAAHELRTPLTTMTGLAEVLVSNRDGLDPAELDECLRSLVRQGTRARDLVNNLLDMAYIERGSTPFADEVISLANVVRSSIDATPVPADVSVHMDIGDEITVRGDADRIQQVIVNLVTNACRYGGAEIFIGATTDGEHVILSVADNGDGVDPELVPMLFDPFARARNANSVGSGLGLAICRRIIDGLGGAITYESAPEPGGRFRVELRRAA